MPGAIVFTLFGAAGQGIANKLSEWKVAQRGEEGSSWLRSKYSPLRKLTDEEYESFIGEKMLKIEAEIALIDDKISELKAEAQAKIEAEGVLNATPSSPEASKEDVSPKTLNQNSQAKSWWR